MSLRQGRLQPTGAVRVLHRVGRRRAPGRLRHTGPPRRRPSCHHPRGGAARLAERWSSAFVAHGASQCGFCTPGIVMRLAAAGAPGGGRRASRLDVEAALRAHLCRCTGWQSIVEAACDALGVDEPADSAGSRRDPLLAAWRSQVEGPAFQTSGPDVVLGGGGFADDAAPTDALVQLGADAPLAPGIRAARSGSGASRAATARCPFRTRSNSRRATGRSPCRRPGSNPPTSSRTPVGAGPARLRPRRWPTVAPSAASGTARCRRWPGVLADETGETVRVLWRREDVVRRGPKRPPLGVGAAVRRHRRRPHRAYRGLGRPGTADGAPARAVPGRPRRRGRGGRSTRGTRAARRRLGRGARCLARAEFATRPGRHGPRSRRAAGRGPCQRGPPPRTRPAGSHRCRRLGRGRCSARSRCAPTHSARYTRRSAWCGARGSPWTTTASPST